MPDTDEVEALLHRLRSTLARLKYEVELMDSLDERGRILSTIDEMRDLLRPRAE